MVRMLYAASKRQSQMVLFDLLLVSCKEHLYSLCRSWLLLPRSLEHQPSRLNFNTGDAKDYKMVAHNFRCQNPVKCVFFAFNRLNELYIFLPKQMFVFQSSSKGSYSTR
jgi:hypothetical protein